MPPSQGNPDSPAPQSARRAIGDLVASLERTFREQIKRAISVELDGSVTSLAFVDHYVTLGAGEDRAPILALLASGAGAYYGELVRRTMGGIWIGDGKRAETLRLLLTPQFVFFSPIDQAYEAILAESPEPDDPRLAWALDASFHLRPAGAPRQDPADDAVWLEARLAELPPVPVNQYYSLTGRFETLELMLELLAAKHAAEGRDPREYRLEDYIAALDGSGRDPSGA